MKENLTKIDDLRQNCMINTEQIEVLLELLLLYIEGKRTISPILELVLEKAKETSNILNEIEMYCELQK